MLIKDRAAIILRETILNVWSDQKSDEMEKRFKKLLIQAEELNRDFKYHDSDPVRWCKRFMKLDQKANELPVQELADLRSITRNKAVIALWARGQKKTTNIVLSSVYEAISLKKDVLIVVISEIQLRHMMSSLDHVCHYDEVRDLVSVNRLNGGEFRIEFTNGVKIVIQTIQNIKRNPDMLAKAKSIYVDDMDHLSDKDQVLLLRDIKKEQNTRFFATPKLRFQQEKQVYSPLQQLIESGNTPTGNITGFHLMHRMASPETTKAFIHTLSREAVMTELEANYQLTDTSLLLGE